MPVLHDKVPVLATVLWRIIWRIGTAATASVTRLKQDHRGNGRVQHGRVGALQQESAIRAARRVVCGICIPFDDADEALGQPAKNELGFYAEGAVLPVMRGRPRTLLSTHDAVDVAVLYVARSACVAPIEYRG